jgi:DNA repair protein RadC
VIKEFKNIPLNDRPREKLFNMGVSFLSDQELIAVIIGTGIKGRDVFKVSGEIASRIKNSEGSLNKTNLLRGIKGLGPSKTAQITAAFELVWRHLCKEKRTINSPEDLLPLVEELGFKKQEHFVVVTIDGGSRLIGKRVVFIGTLNQNIVHPREIFADAIADRARGLFLVHNHPSGNIEPSREDISVTGRLAEVGGIIGIEVIDHLIIAKRDYFSFKENALL